MVTTEVHAAAVPAALATGYVPFQEEVCRVCSLGQVPYQDALHLQESLAEQRKAGERSDLLLLLEHPAVITLGRNARPENVLTRREHLAANGIGVVETNRGGDVTFHGPGQLVGYPILDLSRIRKDVGWYLRTLEEVLIQVIKSLGLAAGRRKGMTGVWVGDTKVAAIGVHISRWVTTHGFALNVTTDLRQFQHIVPCGISTHPVGSIEQLLGSVPPWNTIERNIAREFGKLFGRQIEWISPLGLERSSLCPPTL